MSNPRGSYNWGRDTPDGRASTRYLSWNPTPEGRFHIAACGKNDLPLLRQLLDSGVNVNCRQPKGEHDFGENVLGTAVTHGGLAVTQFLLERGLRVDQHGDNSLHYAAGTGDIPMAELLLKYGASTSRRVDGRTPIECAQPFYSGGKVDVNQLAEMRDLLQDPTGYHARKRQREQEAEEAARRKVAEEAARRTAEEAARRKEAEEAARRNHLVHPYVGPGIMSFRDTSRSVLASGRSLATHVAAAPREERAAQELALMLDALCRSGEFRDLLAVTRVLAKPTGQSVVFGGVYKEQQVAVKVFRDKITKDTAAKEVAYLRRCAHRHVLRVLQTYEFNGRALLVMPLARGDLNGVIERAEGPLPNAQVTEYVKQVATALAFVHDAQRVAHLDLKVGNVFIALSDGRAMLADFGMAMDITDVTRDELLECGTPLYQAPELWAQRLGEPVQRGNRAKVDVYAFGCLVWQLLTRQCPFQREIENDGYANDNFLLLATALRRDRRSPAGMLEARWPEPLRRVIQACCAYEPGSRPTMAQLLAEYLG